MVNLNDTTIAIPVRIESPERERNLDLVLAWFCQETNAPILLLEADREPRYRIKENAGRIEYMFIEDTDYVFYQTRYRNELIRKAGTPIVGLCDTDIIIPANQMEEAVTSIRQGYAKIAYPFSGPARHIGNASVESFRVNMDLSILFEEIRKVFADSGRPTVGGAFFVDKEVYLKAGGENESIYGWGPEDAERLKRMEILGYPFTHVEGPHFHLWHPRGLNSGVGGQELQWHNKKEFIKVCGMNKTELADYITTWDCKGDTIYVSLMCRIGNVLFQLAAAASLAKKHGCKLVAIPSGYYAPEPDNCTLKDYLEPFKCNLLRKVTFAEQRPERYKLYKEPHFHFTPLVFQEGMLLEGLFQSEKYFDKELVRDLFEIDPSTAAYIHEKYGSLLKEEITGINVRRGDFLKLPDSHPVCSPDYYDLAIERIGSNKRFLISSDDIPWCKEYFKGNNFFFVEHISPVIDLYIQTLCTNNIISNSTFSWWGAWLNPNPDKIVIAPKKWFGKNKESLQTKDLLPSEWVRL